MNVNVNLIEQNVSQINRGIMINVDVGVKSIIYVKKIMFGNLLHVIMKMEKILQVLWMIQRLSVMKLESCDEEIKIIPPNFNEKKVTCKTDRFHILLAFLLITIALLIAVSIYRYLIKYQKHLLPFQNK